MSDLSDTLVSSLAFQWFWDIVKSPSTDGGTFAICHRLTPMLQPQHFLHRLYHHAWSRNLEERQGVL